MKRKINWSLGFCGKPILHWEEKVTVQGHFYLCIYYIWLKFISDQSGFIFISYICQYDDEFHKVVALPTNIDNMQSNQSRILHPRWTLHQLNYFRMQRHIGMGRQCNKKALILNKHCSELRKIQTMSVPEIHEIYNVPHMNHVPKPISQLYTMLEWIIWKFRRLFDRSSSQARSRITASKLLVWYS